MAQSSAPITGVNLSDADWRDLFGDEPGVVGDLDGSSYKLTLPTNSDIVAVGSATQASVARVAGFSHRINAGETEGVTVAPAVSTTKTSIITLRYDPTHTGAPGPVRLGVIAGTSSAIPAYDAWAPGTEDLPLWAITRIPGQALSQATTVQLFPRLARSLELPVGSPLPLNSPIGTTVRRGSELFVRRLDSTGSTAWVSTTTTSSYYKEGAGSQTNIGTAPSQPTNGAAVTLPAGKWNVDASARFPLDITPGPRQIFLHIFAGTTEALKSGFTVGTGPTSRNHSDFTQITLTATTTVHVRVSASATGGSQSVTRNAIRAVRAD